MPIWVCGLGVLLILVGLLWCFLRQFEASLYGTIERIAGTVLFLGFGASAVLCWNNQWIEMQDSNTFLYSTIFGIKKAYAFSDILELKQNQDSFTLILETGKVHIESCAVLSDSFVQAVDAALENSHNNPEIPQ